MPMIKKLVFLFKRKSLYLISSKLIISRPQRGNGLSHIAIYRTERACEARPRISIGKKQRSRCGPNILSSPFVITEKAFLLHYLLSGSVESFEESDTTMPKQRTNRPCLFPPGVPTALLVLALLFFAAAAGLAVCYIKRWVCWHIVGLIIYVIFLSCVFPGLLLAFSWSKQKRWSSYIVNFLLHLTFPPTTWSFLLFQHMPVIQPLATGQCCPFENQEIKRTDWHLGRKYMFYFDSQFFVVGGRVMRSASSLAHKLTVSSKWIH